jgi:hypothetical protein
MQFVSAPEEGECLAKGADITFCHYTELDPPEWNMQYLAVVEEYVTCFGEDELGGENNLVRAEIAGLLVGIGKKYDILDTTDGVLEARITALGIASQMGELTSEEMAIVESTSAQTTNTSFMAKLRLKALDALELKDPASFKAKKSLWLQSYERIKLVFEKKVVKILSPPVFLCISAVCSKQNVLIKTIHDRGLEQLNHMYRDLYFVNINPDNGCQKQPFLNKWLADDNKKTYATCAFDPESHLHDNYNTFFGFRAEGIPPVQNVAQANHYLNMILTHIKEIYCDGNQEHADYVYKWLANIIKYPWKKTEVLILIFGIEGCGKGMIIDFFANRVLGHHLSFQTATPGVDLFSKFAVGSHRKLLCFCDEAGEDLAKHHDQLKNLITAKTIRIEKKGQDIRIEENYTNVIVASNNAGPVRISPHDRRVVAFQCNEKYKEDYQYFTMLAEATNSDECARAMYEYFLQYDLSPDYNFQAHRPITKYYETLQAASLPLFWRFLSHKCLTHGSDGNAVKIPARVLYREFNDWKSNGGYEAQYTEVRFGRELKELDKSEGSGVTCVKRSVICYEIKFDVLQSYMIRKKKFDDNAF